MSINTGFDYHAAVPVGDVGKRPDVETIAVMRRNLEGVTVRDGLGRRRQHENWFKDEEQWFYVRGIKR